MRSRFARTRCTGSPNTAFAARSAGGRIAQGHPDGEQIDSLRSGLDEVDAADAGPAVAVVVLPVDHPRIRASTVAALIEAWRADAGPADASEAVVRPVRDGEPGHPTLFPRATWPALRDPSLADGARSVVESARVIDVPVDDPGVLLDIDAPEDLDGLG